MTDLKTLVNIRQKEDLFSWYRHMTNDNLLSISALHSDILKIKSKRLCEDFPIKGFVQIYFINRIELMPSFSVNVLVSDDPIKSCIIHIGGV